MKKPVTILDIAEKANVSPSAVSIALNNRKGISDKTRKRILKLVEKLDYVPNPQARRLLLKYTNNIGILHEEQKSPLRHLFLWDIISAALSKSESLGYNFVFSSISGKRKIEIPDLIKKRDVDGIIVVGEMRLNVLEVIHQYGIPMVLVDDHLRSKKFIAVEADYVQGAELAVNRLCKSGYRNIGYIGESVHRSYGKLTYNGYAQGMEKNGISIDRRHVVQKARAGDENTGSLCLRMMMENGGLPEALFCAADVYAIGAIQELKQQGFSVPEDIAVISMDNILLSKYIEPPLTTIKFDKPEMGEVAVDTAIRLINSEYSGPKKIFFHGSLVERCSVDRD